MVLRRRLFVVEAFDTRTPLNQLKWSFMHREWEPVCSHDITTKSKALYYINSTSVFYSVLLNTIWPCRGCDWTLITTLSAAGVCFSYRVFSSLIAKFLGYALLHPDYSHKRENSFLLRSFLYLRSLELYFSQWTCHEKIYKMRLKVGFSKMHYSIISGLDMMCRWQLAWCSYYGCCCLIYSSCCWWHKDSWTRIVHSPSVLTVTKIISRIFHLRLRHVADVC